MQFFPYACNQKELDPDIRKVFYENSVDRETEDFFKRRSRFFRVKFCIYVLMRVCGWKHYETMGILGYETFLVTDAILGEVLKGRKKENMLDIGAGSGSITQRFERYTENITCMEPSKSFQRKLKRKGYKIFSSEKKCEYDTVCILNVLDVCPDPQGIIDLARENLRETGQMIISLPFPIWVRSKDHTRNRKTNHLSQGLMSFESGVSRFYTEFLQKNGLEVTYFTRIPYIVSLPEAEHTSLYDNGFFVCRKV